MSTVPLPKLRQQIAGFLRALFSRRVPPQARVEDGPEVEMETERKRGMRGL